MRVNLDTHVVLWWYLNPKLLSKEVVEILENEENIIYVSAVVNWEIMMKKLIGKLKVPDSLFDDIRADFIELPIMGDHVLELARLKTIHRDPFDRMLMAQSRVEGLTLVTRDKNILKYDNLQLIKA